MAVTSRPHHRPAIIEADGYARDRFRGLGVKGQPPARVKDLLDVRLAIGELASVAAMLDNDAATLETAEGRRYYGALLGKIVLAIRLCASVTRRRSKQRRASK